MMGGNTFNLDAFNDAAFVAIHDERATEIQDQVFEVLHTTTQRHLSFSNADFGGMTKGQVLGLIMDDASKQILEPDRYKIEGRA